MLKALSEIIDKAFQRGGAEATPEREHGLQVATAVLLVEVARADYAEALAEQDAIAALLKDNFDLSDEETALLVADAKTEAVVAIVHARVARAADARGKASDRRDVMARRVRRRPLG